MSYLPSYRFLQQIDTSRYFMRSRPTKPRGLHPDLFKTVFKNTRIKNTIVTDRSSVFRLEHRMEEICLARNPQQEMLHLETGMVCELVKCPNLAVLSFSSTPPPTQTSTSTARSTSARSSRPTSSCTPSSSVRLPHSDSCQANMEEIVLQFSHLNRPKLRHLQVSSDDQSSKKIELSGRALEEILSCEKLETLILRKSAPMQKEWTSRRARWR